MEAPVTSPTTQDSDGAYLLRDLIRDVPLSADGEDKDIYITAVEAWEGNLYVGTSDAQILHFVSIPPDPASASDQPEYILASRNEPPYASAQTSPLKVPGVEQILLLPLVGKACILCNGTLTFYTLPELSPAFGGKIKQHDCTWIGGLDRNILEQDQTPNDGSVIIICLKSRLRLVRIGEQARTIRNIEVGNILDIQRRDDLACVADATSYSLLDVVNQRKIDLFPISSVPQSPPPRPSSPAPPSFDLSDRPLARSSSLRNPNRPANLRSHDRQVSLGSPPRPIDRLRQESPRRPSSLGTSPTRSAPVSPGVDTEGNPLPEHPQRLPSPTKPAIPSSPLKPHIASPTPNEFLLTTGTSQDEPGVGMFVNLDGDVVRGTVDFTTYPESLLLDGSGIDPTNPPSPGDAPDEGYILAVVRRGQHKVIEYQRWDVGPGESQHVKGWLSLPASDAEDNAPPFAIGLRNAATSMTMNVPEIGSALGLRRLHLSSSTSTDAESDVKRSKDEDQLITQFANIKARVLLYTRDRVCWVVRNPIVVRLESQLRTSWSIAGGEFSVDRVKVQKVINSIRGQEATNEFEFLGFNYIRQQASLLLLIDLILCTIDGRLASEQDKRSTLEALVAGEIDPRTILPIIPILSEEVVEGPQGIWVPGGLRDTITSFRTTQNLASITYDTDGPVANNLLQVVKDYLLVWRRKKGFGSVADEASVTQTIDASLLHLLLFLDADSPSGPARPGSLRAELNDVVDHGVECFSRAVELLEQYQRLYILSRLYQSRKQISQVLATWKRVLDGETDKGGEMIDGEQDVRKYLARIKDSQLVTEYAIWLANRNPRLGAQVFADENSRVRFTPTEAVDLLKAHAPGAVKDYLEHLVFGKNNIRYVNDLISFYLDTVLDSISSSPDTRSLLTDSYSTYRALRPPKPTYRQFITDNAIDETWYSNRLRLLQLIGGSHDAASRYDVETLASRLAPYSDVLVPEMIILNGRRGHHVEALRLLVHGLGDFDTAIRYCLLGGASIFNPSGGGGGMVDSAELKMPSREEQEALFKQLLLEFLHIEDAEGRAERSAELLEKFGSLFDVGEVLALVPEEWALSTLQPFLTSALRRLVSERNESVVVKALAASQNLRVVGGLVEKVGELGPVWEVVKKDSGIA